MKYFVLPALCALPLPALAHPHIFVETAVEIIVDADNRVTGFKVIWTYDDFFSLLITEDLGIDADGDMALTEAEEEVLRGAVKDWPEDYGGDLLVETDQGAVALAERQSHTVAYVDGRVLESHVRPLAEPAAAGTRVDLRVFDPGYYTAYALTGGANVSGSNSCDVVIAPADLEAAYSLVDELLYGRPASDVGIEEAFPEVGAAFADRISVTCPAL